MRRIQTIVGVITKRVEIYDLEINDTKENCVIPVHATRVDRGELLSVENPKYSEMIQKYSHLNGVRMEDTDTKTLLPVHLILGASEYAKIKTCKPQRTGSVGEPVGEYTKFGWVLMSSGAETDVDNMFSRANVDGRLRDAVQVGRSGLRGHTNR